jgi:hypothetical protein
MTNNHGTTTTIHTVTPAVDRCDSIAINEQSEVGGGSSHHGHGGTPHVEPPQPSPPPPLPNTTTPTGQAITPHPHRSNDQNPAPVDPVVELTKYWKGNNRESQRPVTTLHSACHQTAVLVNDYIQKLLDGTVQSQVRTEQVQREYAALQDELQHQREIVANMKASEQKYRATIAVRIARNVTRIVPNLTLFACRLLLSSRI